MMLDEELPGRITSYLEKEGDKNRVVKFSLGDLRRLRVQDTEKGRVAAYILEQAP
jgi:hypothetical protein